MWIENWGNCLRCYYKQTYSVSASYTCKQHMWRKKMTFLFHYGNLLSLTWSLELKIEHCNCFMEKIFTYIDAHTGIELEKQSAVKWFANISFINILLLKERFEYRVTYHIFIAVLKNTLFICMTFIKENHITDITILYFIVLN